MTKEMVNDYLMVFGSESGRRVLADLTKKSGLLKALNMETSISPNKVLVNEGRRSVLMYIYKMLSWNPYDEKQKFAVNEKGK